MGVGVGVGACGCGCAHVCMLGWQRICQFLLSRLCCDAMPPVPSLLFNWAYTARVVVVVLPFRDDYSTRLTFFAHPSSYNLCRNLGKLLMHITTD